MNKGPKFNKVKSDFTTRDNLGIESIASSIQGDLCPVVNTVTPRAFHWIFMVWNYYDYLVNYKTDKWSFEEFNKDFIKKNDYFFILSNLLNPDSDRFNLSGKENVSRDIANNLNGPYKYNREYLKAYYGGMQYNNAGLLTLGYITDKDKEGNEFKFPRLTENLGKPMAMAFEKVIKDTRYYKEYRLKDVPVPKDVLEEFGKAVSLELKNFDECKRLLKEAMFTPTKNANLDNTNLIASAEYIKMLHEKYKIGIPSLKEMRRIAYDWFSKSGDYHYEYPKELEEIITAWELVVGRHYLTMALSLIWKHLLSNSPKPMSLEEWTDYSINKSVWNWDLNANLEVYLDECKYSFDERENIIEKGYRRQKNIDSNVEGGIKLLLDVYNRFNGRDEFNHEHMNAGDEVTLNNLILLVDEYKNKPVKEFVKYIMKKWIVRQHEVTAFNKMMYGKDGYFIENIDGEYLARVNTEPDFNDIRLIELNQVMRDLDMWSE